MEEQGRLFGSNVVSLAEFRERRQPSTDGSPCLARPTFLVPTPTERSVAHQARMLAHLTATMNREREGRTAGS
jgi:hypothetical protein